MLLRRLGKFLLTLALCFVVMIPVYQWMQIREIKRAIQDAQIVVIQLPRTLSNSEGLKTSALASLEKDRTIVVGDDGLSPQVNRLFQFRQSNRLHHGPSSGQPDLEMIVYASPYGQHKAYHFGYIAASGEFGSGQNWYYVPAILRDWIKTLPTH